MPAARSARKFAPPVRPDVVFGLSAVARSLAHRLNNALAVVQGHLALMGPTGGGGGAGADLRRQAVADMRGALGQALSLARGLSAAGCWHAYTPVRIDVAGFLAARRAAFDSLGCSNLSVVRPDELPPVNCDPDYLELAVNAMILHAAARQERVGLRCASGAHGVSISIRLAAPFGRAEAARLRQAPFTIAGGGGLGLWLASEVALLAGGALRAQSRGRDGGRLVLLLAAEASPTPAH